MIYADNCRRGRLPDDVRQLMQPHVENQERILTAAMTGDTELVVEAFLADPLVHGRVQEQQVRELVNDMIKETM